MGSFRKDSGEERGVGESCRTEYRSGRLRGLRLSSHHAAMIPRIPVSVKCSWKEASPLAWAVCPSRPGRYRVHLCAWDGWPRFGGTRPLACTSDLLPGALDSRERHSGAMQSEMRRLSCYAGRVPPGDTPSRRSMLRNSTDLSLRSRR